MKLHVTWFNDLPVKTIRKCLLWYIFNPYLCYLTEYLPLSTYQFGQSTTPSVLFLPTAILLILFNKIDQIDKWLLARWKVGSIKWALFFYLWQRHMFCFLFHFGARGIIFYSHFNHWQSGYYVVNEILFKCCLINE